MIIPGTAAVDDVQDCIDRNFDAVRKKMGAIFAQEFLDATADMQAHLNKMEKSAFQRALETSFAEWCESQWRY